VEHLERSGFVVMTKPPIGGAGARGCSGRKGRPLTAASSRESASSATSEPHDPSRGVVGGEGSGEVTDISAEDRQPSRQEPDADEIEGEAGRQEAAGDLPGEHAGEEAPVPLAEGGPLFLRRGHDGDDGGNGQADGGGARAVERARAARGGCGTLAEGAELRLAGALAAAGTRWRALWRL
jgi:hypothetical protein